MKKFVCSVCGYVYEGEAAPEFCPLCKAPASKFIEQSEEKTWAAEHVVGPSCETVCPCPLETHNFLYHPF